MKIFWMVPLLLSVVQCAHQPAASVKAATPSTAEPVSNVLIKINLTKKAKKSFYEFTGLGSLYFEKNVESEKPAPGTEMQIKLTCEIPLKVKFSGDKSKLEQSISKTFPVLDNLAIGKNFKAAKNNSPYYSSSFFSVKNGAMGNLVEGKVQDFEAIYELQPNSYTKENSELLFLSRNGLGFGTTLAKDSKSKASVIVAFMESPEKSGNQLCKDITSKGFILK
jgi:hypothetical protein